MAAKKRTTLHQGPQKQQLGEICGIDLDALSGELGAIHAHADALALLAQGGTENLRHGNLATALFDLEQRLYTAKQDFDRAHAALRRHWRDECALIRAYRAN